MEELKDTSLEDFEASLAETTVEELDEFSESTMNYERYIAVNKKDLVNFCRVVEPLTKAATDEYSKCVQISSVDNSTVQLKFVSVPYVVDMKVDNKSNKVIRPFVVSISNLKKIVGQAFNSIVLVEEGEGISLAICGSLLFLETKPLDETLYQVNIQPVTKEMDRELSIQLFNKVGAVLSLSERASEKVILIKNNSAYINTSFFAAKIKSPLKDSRDCILYRAVAQILGVLADLSKVSLKYEILDEKIYVNCDGNLYCELPLGPESKLGDFYSPLIDQVLTFDSTIVVMNDNLIRLVSLVHTLDYLSDVIDIEFTETEMKVTIMSSAQANPSVYPLRIVEGRPEVLGNFKIQSKILKMFLSLASSDVKYAFTEAGLGVSNSFGSFIVRKN